MLDRQKRVYNAKRLLSCLPDTSFFSSLEGTAVNHFLLATSRAILYMLAYMYGKVHFGQIAACYT